MKTVGANLLTHLAEEVTTIAACWKLTTANNVVRGFTSHTVDLTVSGVLYRSAQGFTPTTIQGTSGMGVDNLNIHGFLDALGIREVDVNNGVYDGAQIEVFMVNHADLTHGIVKMRKGFLGNVKLSRQGFESEVRGLLWRFQRTILELYSPGCRADLGDARCGVRLAPSVWTATMPFTARVTGDAKTGSLVKPTVVNGFWYHCSVAGTSGGSEPTWNLVLGGMTTDGTVTWITIAAKTVTGSVTTFTNKRIFRDTTRTEVDAWFMGGLLTWTSGENAGLTMEVKQFTAATKEFELALPMRNAIVVGDAYSVYAGCDKILATCKNKFGNVQNFRGEPFVPQEQSVAISAIR